MPIQPPEDQVFFEINVNHDPRGGTLVFWGLKRGFIEPGPYTFQLQWGEASSADFVNTGTPVVDAFLAVDPEPRVFAKSLESYYRIKLITGTGKEFLSFPQQATGTWRFKQDWLYAREISRKELLLHEKFVGWKGWLLKRKVGGPVCPECVDYDSQVAKGNCTVCFGTGKAGGYWKAEKFFAYPYEGFTRKKEYTDDRNLVEHHIRQMRMPACPSAATYDVFVNEDTGERWVMHGVKDTVGFKGIPIVAVSEFWLANYKDVIYDVPLVPVVEPYPEVEDVSKLPEGPMSTDFLELPDLPAPPVPDPEPEPEAEEEIIVEEELIIETGVRYGLWFDTDEKEWFVGQDIGDTGNAQFKSDGAIGNVFFLHEFDWVVVNAPGGSTFTFDIDTLPTIFTASSSVPGVTGNYIQAGTYNNIFAFLQEI